MAQWVRHGMYVWVVVNGRSQRLSLGAPPEELVVPGEAERRVLELHGLALPVRPAATNLDTFRSIRLSDSICMYVCTYIYVLRIYEYFIN